MKMLLVYLLILSGCATFTHRNINVYDRQRPPTIINETRLVVENVIKIFGFEQNRIAAIEIKTKELIDYVINELGHEKLFKEYDFVFTLGWVGQPVANGKVIIGDGLTDLNDKIIYLMVRDCFADSAILHEMSHVIHNSECGDGDQEHKDKAWWNIIQIMSKKMVDNLCQLNYIRNDTPPIVIY